MGLLNRRLSDIAADDIDRLTNDPEPSFWGKWFGGVVAPILLAFYGGRCYVLKEAILFGRRGRGMEVSGTEAEALGLAWIFAALFCHFHYFWTASPRLAYFSELGKIIAGVGFVGSFGYALWRIAINMFF